MLDWIKGLIGRGQSKPGSKDFARDLLNESFEAFRLARRDRPREHYQPHGYSGDAAIIGSHDLMHRRTRDLNRNTAQAKRIISAIVDLVVGTGMQTYSWPFASSELFEAVTEIDSLESGSLGPRLSFALESDDLFDEWANDPSQFDSEGRLSWPEMQRMLLGESALVGDGLLIRSFRKDYSIVPLSYQIIEREQLDQSKDRPAGKGDNKIVGGKEFDENNRCVAYHIYLDHPHDAFGIGQSGMFGAGASIAAGQRRQRIPAERVIDLALFGRPSASLGVSWLNACGQAIWDRDSYMDSEIRSAAIDAVFAFVAKLQDAEQHGALGFDDGLDDNDSQGNRAFKVGHSPVASVINPDESLEMVRATRPNKDAPTFIKLLDHDIAGATPLSYYSLSGNYESTNFSSSRAAKLDEDLRIRPLQNWFATTVAIPIRREFNAIAAASGQFRSLSPSEFRKNARTYQRFDAIGNGRDLLDPFKEGEARTARLRTGISTFKEECARVGKHWIRVLMQKAVEERVSKMFGVDLDFSKAGNGTSAASQSDEADEDTQADQIADRVAMLLGD